MLTDKSLLNYINHFFKNWSRLKYSYHPSTPLCIHKIKSWRKTAAEIFQRQTNLDGYYWIMGGEIFEKIRKKTFEVSKFSSPYCSGILTLKYSECLLHTFTPKSHWTPRLLRLAKSSLLIFAINLYLLFFFWEHKLLKQLYQLLLKY